MMGNPVGRFYRQVVNTAKSTYQSVKQWGKLGGGKSVSYAPSEFPHEAYPVKMQKIPDSLKGVTARKPSFASKLQRQISKTKLAAGKVLHLKGVVAKHQLIQDIHHFSDLIASKTLPSAKQIFLLEALKRNRHVVRDRSDHTSMLATLSQDLAQMKGAFEKGNLDGLGENFIVWESLANGKLKKTECALIHNPNNVNKYHLESKKEQVIGDAALSKEGYPASKTTPESYGDAITSYKGEKQTLPPSFAEGIIHDVTMNAQLKKIEGFDYSLFYQIMRDLPNCSRFIFNGEVLASTSHKPQASDLYRECLGGFGGDAALSQHALLLTTQGVNSLPTAYMNLFSNIDLGYHIKNDQWNVTLSTDPDGRTTVEHELIWHLIDMENPEKPLKVITSKLTISVDTNELRTGELTSATAQVEYSPFIDFNRF